MRTASTWARCADVDFKVTPETEARARLARFALPPSAAVHSGGGLHVYWFLREPLDLRDPAACIEARRLLRRLASALGGDRTAAEPARVLRLPGTFNRKPEYGAPRPVVLEILAPDQRYNPSELDDVLPPEPDDAPEGGAFVLPERIAAHEPGRNHVLWCYGRSLKAKGWKLAGILAELERVNRERCEPPLPKDELGDVAHNVMTEADRPMFAARRNGGPAVGHNLTDLGNAGRLVAQHGEDLRHCYTLRSYLSWAGPRWQRDAGDVVMARTKQMVRSIYAEAAAERDLGTRTAIAAWARKSEHEARLRAATFLAQSEPGVPIDVSRFDADPMALNVVNGTIDLRTGQLRPHRREDYCTKLSPVVYDTAAECPRWRRFLAEIFAGKARLITFVQKAIGYALTGDTSEQVFFLLWGSGANGKTTLLKTTSAVLGDYALSTRPETFMVKGPDAIPNDVARLRGARKVTAVEADSGQRLAEALIKQMTGGDVMTARFMRAEFFDFVPMFKIFLASNFKPVIRGSDHAMWRRVRLIPFAVTVPPEAQDRQLDAKLLAEAPGILRWAIEGCLLWQQEGLGLPDEVRAATDTYRAEMDALGSFLAERCLLDPKAEVTAADLYAAYRAWCEETKEHLMPKRTFGLRLAEGRGAVAARTSAARGWRGIRRRTPADPEAADPAPGDATGLVTQEVGDSRLASHDARAICSSGNTRHLASPVTDASPADETLL